MKVADNIAMLELTDERGTYRPTFIWDDHERIMVDTGLPGQLGLIAAALEPLGFRPSDITKVIVTHQDLDHIGCVNDLRALGASVLAHEDEIPYLDGTKTSVRLAELELDLASRDNVSPGEREYLEQARADAPKYHFKVDRALRDGEVLEYCGGIRVIHTPGHMPGHIVLHLLASDILVSGDAANIIDGKFIGPNPVFTGETRMPQAQESFAKLMALKPRTILCFHGGVHHPE